MIIYGLLCYCDNAGIRYVGMTKQSPNTRFRQHLNDRNKYDFAVSRWLRKHYEHGIEMRILEEVKSLEQLAPSEISWIQEFKEQGRSLLNGTNGGWGMHSGVISEETRARMSAAQTGRKHSEETKRKISEGQKNKPPVDNSPEARAIRSAKAKSAITPEVREKMRTAALSREPQLPEFRRKQGDQLLGSKNVNSLITEDDAWQIRLRRASGEPVKDIAPDYGVLPGTVYSVTNNHSWRHVAHPTEEDVVAYKNALVREHAKLVRYELDRGRL